MARTLRMLINDNSGISPLKGIVTLQNLLLLNIKLNYEWISDTLLHEVEKERNKRISLKDKLKGEDLKQGGKIFRKGQIRAME